MNETSVRPEILAPAGDFICLQAALDAGADAVYFGLGTFNMRARSGVNFTEADLPEIASRCRARGVKAYLALNAIMFEDETEQVAATIRAAKPYVDAFIVSDWGVIALCRREGVPFHVSTQMSTSNSEAVKFLAAQGATRVVLARECTLAEVKKIISTLRRPDCDSDQRSKVKGQTEEVNHHCLTSDLGPQTSNLGPPSSRSRPCEIECFVHGAQCVAESGRCFMSQDVFGKSACRGECVQPCRRKFLVKAVDLYENEEGQPVHEGKAQYVVEPHTVLSAKDLCSLGFVDKLMAAGIASFKIEGRARNANYVKTVVSAYRAAVDAVLAGTYTPELVADLTARVKTVFHREFAEGLYFGRPGADQFTATEDSLATTVKRHVGIVIDYFAKAGIAQVKIQDHEIRPGDALQIHGPTTGVAELTLGELRRDDERPAVGARGTWVTFRAPRCRVGDKVFFVERIERTDGGPF